MVVRKIELGDAVALRQPTCHFMNDVVGGYAHSVSVLCHETGDYVGDSPSRISRLQSHCKPLRSASWLYEQSRVRKDGGRVLRSLKFRRRFNIYSATNINGLTQAQSGGCEAY